MPAPRIALSSLSPYLQERAKQQYEKVASFFEGTSKPSANEQKIGVRQGRKKPTLTPDMADYLVKSVKVSEDGNQIQIILSVEPSQLPTAQQKGAFVGKDGKVHFFTKSKIAKAGKALAKALAPYAHLTSKWGRVPLQLTFDSYFSYPSSTPKKHRHKIGPHLERPDGDNLLKLPADILTDVGFWEDDSLIDTYIIRKRRTTGPACIKISIENLQPKFDKLFAAEEAADKPTLFNQDAAKPEETNPLSELTSTPQTKTTVDGM